MRVTVFGAGAVGGLLGARLFKARHEVVLVAREEDVVAIRLNGLRSEGLFEGTFDITAVDALTEGMSTEAVVLTVKAPDVRAAGEELARRLHPVPPILALQNGLGIEDELEAGLRAGGATVSPGSFVRGVNSLGVTRVSPGVVRLAGEGELILGEGDDPDTARTNALFADLLGSAGVRVRRVADLPRELWRKVLVNAAVNPVTADHGILNGQLSRDPWRGQAEKLLLEARQVAAAEGFGFTEAEAEAELWKVVRATARNRSSMLQDLDRGHRTEIDAISGALLALGRRRGLKLPQTERIVARIHAKEAEGTAGARPSGAAP
ncbi:MAG TPA: 2-dehydropantoate 2-reductase [Thermoplasmata archaeon]|nr:2-dehydropantoate 2-reductase [Thermoplasmata archaeon]